ncbi:COP1-interactive protein 1-like isoform X1 [Argentina anserina]|uniref:COP1-interactive protein 1-like isoform X1 n=1 Tax=Argentina anserina TaxID=57926 RepID=UPI0021765083|nr:COP1-interactive protein 1-like isoform X1 [Potentilla anserina]XP_050377016.1 COP1-interactive protein 1-like isoform X1 [Potentilla anserina]
MRKHRFRDSMKSLFGSHIDAEKDEQLKGTKIDMEDKVQRILKLLKDDNIEEKDSNMVDISKKEPLAELIQDFHQQYQSLYAEYDHLTGVLKKKVHGKQDKDSSSSSSSESDSEYPSNDKKSKNGLLESDYQKIADVNQELESAHLEVADLKRKLTATVEEKEALNLEHVTALSKIEETEKISKDLKTDAERLDAEKLKLLAENTELNQKLETGEKKEAELSRQLEDMERERDNLMNEKETGLRRIEDGEKRSADLQSLVDQLKDEKVILEQQLESVRVDISNMKHELESSEQQASDLSKAKEEETLKGLKISTEIQQAHNVIQELSDEATRLKKKLDQKELDLESVQGQKRDLEVKFETMEKTLAENNAGLQAQISELVSVSKEREADLSALKKKLEETNNEHCQVQEQLGQREIDFSTLSERHKLHYDETLAQIKGLEDKVTELETALESLQCEKRDMVVKFESKEKHLEEENAGLQAQISELESVSKEKEAELSALTKKFEETNNEHSQVREQLGQRELEYLTLSERHKLHQDDTLAQIKGLEDKVTELESAIESMQGEKRDMEEKFESKEKQLAQENAGLQAQISELESISKEKEAELSALTKKFEETINEHSQVQEHLGQRELECLTLSERHKLHQDETLAQIKGLEDKATELVSELEFLQGEKRDMEVKFASKEKELAEENADLQARISDLESMSTEREDELSALTKKHQDISDESSSTIADLTAQVNNLLADLSSVRREQVELEENMAHKGDEASTQIKGLMEQVSILQQQLESLHSQKAELQAHLENKTQEISEYVIQVQILNEEIAKKTTDHQTILEEKENLIADMKDLELKMESMQNQKDELEEEMRKKILEHDQLKAEMLELKDQSSVFEKTMAQREVDFSSLQEKHETGQNEAAAQVVALVAQVNGLQEELDSLQTQKNQIELQFEREKQELLDSLTLLETDKIELTSKTADLQRQLNEQGDLYSKLNEEHKQLEAKCQDHKVSVESKDQIIADLEQMSEDLKRDLEEKGDELSSLVEKSRNTEVKLRLSNQKLRVTEQVLAEKEQNFRIAELKFQEEQKVLEDRIAALSGIITANNEAYQRNINCISDNLNSSLIAMESVIKKLANDYVKYEKCIVETSVQLRIAKKWVAETNDEREKLNREVGVLSKQLQDKKHEALVFKERAEKLETEASKEQMEKGDLIKAVNQLEKKVEELKQNVEGKDEGILSLGEEKREAIRQLCIWIEYHQSRYDHLKEVHLKMAPRGQRRV